MVAILLVFLSVFHLVAFFQLILSIQAFSQRERDAELAAPTRIGKKAEVARPGAIPWLLLKAKTNEGTGKFARVTYIQRVNTDGGLAPGCGCDQAHVKTEVRVPYSANYYFYAAQR